MSEFILKPGDKASLAWTPQGDGEKKHGIKLNVSQGSDHQVNLPAPDAETIKEAEMYFKRLLIFPFDPETPAEMNPRYIFWAAQRALTRAYYQNEDLAETKIKLVCKGEFNLGDMVAFCYGLKGRVSQIVKDKERAVVEVFLADFRKMWNSLTTAQRFDEE